MRVLVVGSGGREHTICWKLRQDHPEIELFCAPGNGGIASLATLVKIRDSEIDQLVEFALDQKIDLTIVGPELPLSLGIVDRFQAAGLKIFGPTKSAAMIESSKAFAKELMVRYEIPTAYYQVFTDRDTALDFVRTAEYPLVVKVDGLAAGKGVFICNDYEAALEAIKIGFNNNNKLIVEEFLVGEEISLMAFVSGETVVPMQAAQDHKQVFDGDQGPNTGGMGAYSPLPHISPEIITNAINEIVIPTAKALVTEGRSFTGILYAGLILTANGVKVIEFNARFGDPEAQVILPRMKTDLLSVLFASLEGKLDSIPPISWDNNSMVAVVTASQGYPGDCVTGKLISGLSEAIKRPGINLFHSGTELSDIGYLTAGGRVLAVVGSGVDLQIARKNAYAALDDIDFAGMHFRQDIAAKALAKTVLN